MSVSSPNPLLCSGNYNNLVQLFCKNAKLRCDRYGLSNNMETPTRIIASRWTLKPPAPCFCEEGELKLADTLASLNTIKQWKGCFYRSWFMEAPERSHRLSQASLLTSSERSPLTARNRSRTLTRINAFYTPCAFDQRAQSGRATQAGGASPEAGRNMNTDAVLVNVAPLCFYSRLHSGNRSQAGANASDGPANSHPFLFSFQ